MEPSGVQILQQKIGIPFLMNFTEGRIRNAVKRHETQMVPQNVQFFVDVDELAPPNMDPNNEGGKIEWRGDRGWFNQYVKIARQRGLEGGYYDWTGAVPTAMRRPTIAIKGPTFRFGRTVNGSEIMP